MRSEQDPTATRGKTASLAYGDGAWDAQLSKLNSTSHTSPKKETAITKFHWNLKGSMILGFHPHTILNTELSQN